MFLFLFPGVHILQSIIGCNVNENSGEVSCFLQFGFNGEGIFEFDPKTKTIITLKPELQISEQMLNDHRNLIKYVENLFSMFHPKLKIFLDYGSSSLNKKGNSCVELKVRIFHVAKMTLFYLANRQCANNQKFFFSLDKLNPNNTQTNP